MIYLAEQLGAPCPSDPSVIELDGIECSECGRVYDSFWDADLCEAECNAGRKDWAGGTV